MKKISLFIILTFLLFVACDRPASNLNPFDPESDLQADMWGPDSLSAEYISDSKLLLRWTQSKLIIDGFDISRSEGDGAYHFLVHADTFAREYLDTALSINAIYSYAIVATAGDNRSSADSTLDHQTNFPIVEDLRIQTVNDTAVIITWSHNYLDEGEYVVERRVNEEDFVEIGRTNKDQLFFSDQVPSVGTCIYRVYAESPYNRTAFSNEINIFSQPSLITSMINDHSISLNWDNEDSYDYNYFIERKHDDSDFSVIDSVLAGTYNYTDSGLTVNITYTYRVIAYDKYHRSEASNSVDQTTEILSPTMITSVPVDDQSIELSWQHDCSYEKGYRIERRVGTDSYQEIDTTSANELAYTDTGLTINTDYKYKVCAYTDYNTSDYSEVVLIRTTFPEPNNLMAEVYNEESILLSWAHSCDFEEGYIIEREESSGNYLAIGHTEENVFSFIEDDLIYGETYTYRVNAYTSHNYSAYSNSEIVELKMNTPDLYAVLIDGQTIELDWEHECNFENGYLIQRSTRFSEFSDLIEVGSNIFTYTDNYLNGAETYIYRIVSFVDNDSSAFSNSVSQTTELKKPTDLIASVINDTDIELTWLNDFNNEDGFRIERKNAGGTYSEIGVTSADSLSYTDPDLVEGTYYYRVYAYKGMRLSDYSNEISISIDLGD